jgi:SAM-dependent methyltransferase
MAAGWDDRHAYMERSARPVTEWMVDRLQARPGDTVLELAAGTGIVGFTAARTLDGKARLIVSDFSPAMLEAARRDGQELGLEDVEYRVLDAEGLDLPDQSVDGGLCRWGYMLMGDPGQALAETRRVLMPGGRLSCAVFGSPQDNPWAAVPMSVLVDLELVPRPESGQPSILALADTGRLRELFLGAGLGEPELDEVPFSWEFEDYEDYWRFLSDLAGAIAVTLNPLDEGQRAQVSDELQTRVEPYRSGNGYELPALSLVASAARP